MKTDRLVDELRAAARRSDNTPSTESWRQRAIRTLRPGSPRRVTLEREEAEIVKRRVDLEKAYEPGSLVQVYGEIGHVVGFSEDRLLVATAERPVPRSYSAEKVKLLAAASKQGKELAALEVSDPRRAQLMKSEAERFSRGGFGGSLTEAGKHFLASIHELRSSGSKVGGEISDGLRIDIR